MDDYPLMDVFWTMLMFMFMFMWVWIVVSTFADNFRRNDHGGVAKAMWTLFIVFLPVLGVLCYMIARPKMTEQDQQMIAELEERQRRLSGVSSADEIAKAQELLSSGAISQDEFNKLKTRALA